jgi:hypothetical protein
LNPIKTDCVRRWSPKFLNCLFQMLRLWRLIVLGSVLAGGFPANCFADSDMHTVLGYTSGARITAGSPVNGGTRYGRIIRLQYNGVYNGTLIATYESWPNDFRFYKSTDDGFTWTQIGAQTLSSISGWVMKVEPDLYELPTAVGNLPTGTILLAGNCRTNDFNINSHRMEVWYSTNQGVSWQYRGVADQSANQGLWEPRINLSSSGQLVCYYSDERFQSSGYNQLLGERVSADGGLTWSPEVYVVAVADGVKRPGMAITARLPNGQYVMSYEGVGFGAWSQVYIKFSSDGTNWGSATDLGTAVQTSSGAYVGACPYIMWSPAGGPNGTLVVSGQFLKNSSNTDREFFINSNLGQGNWTMIPAAVQWQGGGNNLVGWSQGMIPTVDGQGVIQMSSSQITVSGNTNNNEMLVGREQLLVPGRTYTVANQKSGLAVDIPGNSPVHGVGLQQSGVNGGASQKWTFNDLGNNVWTVTNSGNSLAWDDTGWNTNAGTMLEQWDYNGLAVQQFKLRPVGNGGWKFISVNANLPVSVTNASLAAGAQLIFWTNNTSSEQNWFPSQPNNPQAAWYALEGNTLDGSGNGNDGAPSATATNYVAGQLSGRALQFNGVNSYVQLPRSIGGGAFLTIAFWMKTSSIGATGSNWYEGAGLVDGEVSGVTNDFGVSLLNGKIAFGVGSPDTTLQSSVTVNDGAWHHVAVTRDSLDGRMAIWIDGMINTNAIGPLGGRVAPPFLRLGSLQTGVAGKFYNGTLDDVRLFNSWLDANTFAQLLAPPALQAWLKFDESSGTTAADSSGHGWTSTLVNGATWAAGYNSNAVSLNSSASNYVSLPAGILSNLNSFTVATWVKMNTRATWARIFDFGTSTDNYMFLSPAASPSGLRFAITTSGGGGEQLINYTNNLSTGVWHHVAVTLTAGTGILYVDGVPAATNTISLTPASLGATTQNWIGRSQYPADPYLNGLVDDFRIYSGVLSPTEIASFVTPLAAPAGFTGTRGDGLAILSWSGAINANGYNLKRSLVNAGPYTPIASNLASLSFTNGGLLNGTNYYFVVTATNSAVESGNSIQVNVRPVSASPPQLSYFMNVGQLQLTWPGDHAGWILQMQTNSFGGGIGTNWVTAPGSSLDSQYLSPVNPNVGSAFFRLLSPY